MPEPAPPPEAQARRRIDALLEASGWTVQDRAAVNLTAGGGVAVRELPLPFRYESTGVETFFTNGLDPDPTARRVFSLPRSPNNSGSSRKLIAASSSSIKSKTPCRPASPAAASCGSQFLNVPLKDGSCQGNEG